MADIGTTVEAFFATLLSNPLYVLLLIGAIVFIILILVVYHIHKVRSEDIFVHQAWGANWKGR